MSPTDDSVQYSLNTLQYANRVRQMTMRNKKKYDKFLGLKQLLKNKKPANFIRNELNQPQQQQQQQFSSLNSNNNYYIKKENPNNLNENPHKHSTVSSKYFTDNEQSKSNNQIVPPNANHNLRMPERGVLLEFENSNFKMSSLNDQNLKPPKIIDNESRRTSLNSIVNKDTQANNIQGIFHPSKINMASTPIKANRLERE